MSINKLLFISFLIVTVYLLLAHNAFAYLDPGTGSYIFQVLVAAFVGGLFTIKIYWQKIKIFFGNLFRTCVLAEQKRASHVYDSTSLDTVVSTLYNVFPKRIFFPLVFR
jgi:hypothetical protein